MLGKRLDRKLVRLGNVFLRATAHILGLGLGAQKALLQIGNLCLSLGERGIYASLRFTRFWLGPASRVGGLARGVIGGRGILARRILLRVFHVAESR
ncbi:hypothetical protein GCM10027093_52920 [Paraburkholderia jirisanensis]